MVGEGEKKVSIEAEIMEIEFTRNRKLAGFILAFDVLQNLLAMFLQHSYFCFGYIKVFRVFHLNGPDSKCPSATESATSYLSRSHQ